MLEIKLLRKTRITIVKCIVRKQIVINKNGGDGGGKNDLLNFNIMS